MAFAKKRKVAEPIYGDTYSEHERNSEGNTDFAENTAISVDSPLIMLEKQQQTQSNTSNTKPLYNEVTLVPSAGGKNPGGSKVWVCKHCKNSFTGSYTRIHAHFFGLAVGKRPEIRRCDITNNRSEFIAFRRVEEAEKNGVSSSLKTSTITTKQSMGVAAMKPIQGAFNVMEREMVDLKIMRGLYANGIPFNVLRNPQFGEIVTAINRAPKYYKAPSFERARTTLLDECKMDLEKDLSSIKDTWYNQGVSIVSDGWTNTKHNSLINVIAQNSRGAMFMYAEDFSGVEKIGQVIAEFIRKAIDEVGPSNVFQAVTNNASNYKAVGKEIEKVHRHIFWSPCVVHSLSLILKTFAKEMPWLESVYNWGKTIVEFVLGHGQTIAMFRANSGLDLLKVAKTRFASHYVMLKGLLDCREALATTIVLNCWKDWIKHVDVHIGKLGEEVVKTIKCDDFWEGVENALDIMKSIYYLIKFADSEGPKMGEIYEQMDNMMGQVKDIMAANRFKHHYPRMEQIILYSLEKMSIPFHCLAFVLCPRFYDCLLYTSDAADE